MSVLPVCMHVHHEVPGTHRGPKRMLDSPPTWSDRWLWTALWVLGAEPRLSGRTVNAFDWGVISPAPYSKYLDWWFDDAEFLDASHLPKDYWMHWPNITVFLMLPSESLTLFWCPSLGIWFSFSLEVFWSLLLCFFFFPNNLKKQSEDGSSKYLSCHSH